MGSPDVLSSVGHDFPSLAAGPTCPRGPGAAGPGQRWQNVGFQSAEPDWQESHFYFGVPSSTWECCEE